MRFWWAPPAILAAVGAALLMLRDTVTGDPNAPEGSPDGLKGGTPRDRVVAAARAELGKGESAKYWKDVDPELAGTNAAWCGGFALWCLHQAGLAKNIQWITGKGFLGRLHRLDSITDAKPGDIAYYNKFQHHAVVAANNGDGTLDDINGNGSGGKVTETKNAKPDAVYSIQSLIESASA